MDAGEFISGIVTHDSEAVVVPRGLDCAVID
jgi:hypothetical protein